MLNSLSGIYLVFLFFLLGLKHYLTMYGKVMYIYESWKNGKGGHRRRTPVGIFGICEFNNYKNRNSHCISHYSILVIISNILFVLLFIFVIIIH